MQSSCFCYKPKITQPSFDDSATTALQAASLCLHQQPYAVRAPLAYSAGEDIAEDLKKIAKAMNRRGKLRVARSSCMDLCAFDPNMMIWPEGLWLMKVTKQVIRKSSKLA